MDAATCMLGMAENNAWANHRLHRACAELTLAEYKAERTGFFPSLHTTLTHIVLVDWYYLDALERGGRGRAVFANRDPFESHEPLREAQRAADQRLVAYVKGAPDLDAPVAIQRPNHEQMEKAGAVLLHLFEHQIHHRGQAHAMLAGTRVPPPQLDEFFMSEDAPLRAAELVVLGLRVR